MLKKYQQIFFPSNRNLSLKNHGNYFEKKFSGEKKNIIKNQIQVKKFNKKNIKKNVDLQEKKLIIKIGSDWMEKN